MNTRKKFKMSIVIDGYVDVDDEFTLPELNKHLAEFTNDIIKVDLSVNLDIPKDIITVESRYE